MLSLLLLVLAATVSSLVEAGHPPSVCKGWPAADSAIVGSTNYSNPDLPDLLTFLNGTKVTAPGALWEARRDEIKFLLQKYFYGTLPSETPPLVGVNSTTPVAVRGGLRSDVRPHPSPFSLSPFL